MPTIQPDKPEQPEQPEKPTITKLDEEKLPIKGLKPDKEETPGLNNYFVNPNTPVSNEPRKGKKLVSSQSGSGGDGGDPFDKRNGLGSMPPSCREIREEYRKDHNIKDPK